MATETKQELLNKLRRVRNINNVVSSIRELGRNQFRRDWNSEEILKQSLASMKAECDRLAALIETK